MRKLATVLALAGTLTLAACSSPYSSPTPTPTQDPQKGTVIVEDVQGGDLICTTYGERIISCDWVEIRYPDE